jgi:hypothetical protein
MRRMRHVASMGEARSAYKILVETPEGNTPLGRLGHKWVGNTTLDLRELVWEGVDWMHLVQDRDQWRALVNTVMNLRAPQKLECF